MTEENPFRVVYVLIWKSNKPDDEFDAAEFECRIPRLMEWLKNLKKKDKLVACGGGGFENHAGGLTLINADSIEEAQQLSNGTPMNEIGTTEIMVWDVYYGDLLEKEREKSLAS